MKRGYARYRAFSPPDFAYNGAGIFQLYHLSVPVTFRYYLFQRKNAYFVSTGGSVDHSLTGSRLDKKVGFSYLASVGSLIKVSKDLHIRVEPTFQYAMSDYRVIPHNRGIYQLRPNAFGINVGIRKGI